MRKLVSIVIVGLGLLYSSSSPGQEIISIKEKFSTTEFTFDEVSGIGYEAGCTRRDSSDVIKVGCLFKIS